MDTIIIKNQIHPIKYDSIKVYIDNSQLIYQLDSLRNDNITELKELRETILIANKKDSFTKYISNEALFTTFTTILVFTLGILINILIKRCERNKLKRKTRIFVKHHLDKITSNFATRLESSYTKFSNDTTIDTGISLTPPKILSNDFQRILNIDTKELFNAIANKEAISNVISQIEFMNNLVSEVQYYHANALKRSNQFREKLNHELSQYLDSVAEFIEYERLNTPNYENNDSYKLINESISLYYNEMAGKRTLERFYNEILRPIQQHLVDTDLFRTHEVGKVIASKGKNLSHLFNDLFRHNDEFKEQYKEFAEYIKNSNERLEKEIKKINWR